MFKQERGKMVSTTSDVTGYWLILAAVLNQTARLNQPGTVVGGCPQLTTSLYLGLDVTKKVHFITKRASGAKRMRLTQ